MPCRIRSRTIASALVAGPKVHTILARRAAQAAGVALADAQKLKQELESLRHERKQVRARIEKLLGQIDELSAG